MSLTLLFVVAAACRSGGGDEAAPTTAAPTSSTTTSTSAPTTTTSVPFDVEVKQAAIDLLEIRNDVFQHPDVARVSDYIADTCTCLERERGAIERFVNEGLRWTDRAVQVRGINLTVDDATLPSLTFVAFQPEMDVIRMDGAVAEHGAAVEHATYRVSLLRNERGEWRLNLLEVVDLNDDTIAAVLREGIP